MVSFCIKLYNDSVKQVLASHSVATQHEVQRGSVIGQGWSVWTVPGGDKRVGVEEGMRGSGEQQAAWLV